MDVKVLASQAAILTVAVWCGATSHGSESAFSGDTRMQTIAPTVTQVSFNDYGCDTGCDKNRCSFCDSGCVVCNQSNVCDSNCGCGDGGCGSGCACDAGPSSCSCYGCDSGCSSGGCSNGDCASGGCFGFGLLGDLLSENVFDSTSGQCGLLGYGLVKKSEPCFQDFISPMTNPVFFEDPRNLSELRFLFINHVLPNSLGGNSVQVYAMQVRARLSDRWSLIATKDGFIASQSPLVENGYADLSAGLKYSLYRNPQKGILLSLGTTYEMPTGSNKSLQGNGNGVWNFFATGGFRFRERWHVLAATGLRQPNDENLENGVFYRSVHIDRRMGDRRLYLFTEFNWSNYLNSGNAFPVAIEGGDLFNFGAPNITGNDLVTNAIGMRAKPSKHVITGVAWEYPITKREGIMKNRLTADLIFRY
jgi:hypothetical protein